MATRQEFEQIVRQFDSAVVIVIASPSTDTDDPAVSTAGCVVGFHTQCSIEPPRYCVWLSRVNRTYKIASVATTLRIVALGNDDHDLAELFGSTTGDDVDKFAVLRLTDRSLPETWMQGPIVEIIDVAHFDHVGFVIDPTEAATANDAAVRALRLIDLDDVNPGHPVETDEHS